MELKLEKLNKSYSVKTNSGLEIGSLQFDSDGSYYFYQNSEVNGYWSSHTLREIARLLEELDDEAHLEKI